MKRLLSTIVPFLFGFVGAVSEPVLIDGRIIQYKNDRLYFDLGQESNLYAGSPFMIKNGNDTIYTSTIERSYEGICISEPCDNFFDTLSWTEFEAVFTPARFDSSSVLRFATDGDPDILIPKRSPSETQDSLPAIAYNSGIDWFPFENRIDMLHGFRAGKFDCLVSFNDYSRQIASARIVWSPAPFIALLIPNLSRRPSQGAVLTTSLYYRFDGQRLGLYFEGDRVQPIYSFRGSRDPGNRMYEYDPDRGRLLFARVDGNPRRLNIYVGHPSLQRLANYFGDILARERCRLTVVDEHKKADLYLEFVPVNNSSPANTMSNILNMIESDCSEDESLLASINSCRRQLEWSTNDPDSSRVTYHLRLANRTIVNDLGIFPLFRPSIHVTTQSDIKGIGTNPQGNIVLTTARRIIVSPIPEVRP